jgi:hypothetical protein
VRLKLVLLGVGVMLGLAGPGWAQQGTVLEQQLDADGAGYTVMAVWGSHHEMGYAQGYLLADGIMVAVEELRQNTGGGLFEAIRAVLAPTVWQPAAIDDELDGLVAGVSAARPDVVVDRDELRAINVLSDLIYGGCRSHSAWGSYVAAPTRTLSTRRLDWAGALPPGTRSISHHVLLARAPTDGSLVRWVGLGWPGYVTPPTAVNEFGTLAGLHDVEPAQTRMVTGAHLPRSVSLRFVLTLPDLLAQPPDQHLDRALAALGGVTIMTTEFLNYFVPEGHGGVFTCREGQVCAAVRVPQADYLGGEAILSANLENDGHAAPPDDDFMGPYYLANKPKTLADHYELMGHAGTHLMSVDYRGPGDMTIWAEGQLPTTVTPTIKVEWAALFAAPLADDGGVPADAGPVDAAGLPDDAAPAGADAAARAADDGGCGCRVPGGGSGLLGGVAVLALALRRGRRRRCRR